VIETNELACALGVSPIWDLNLTTTYGSILPGGQLAHTNPAPADHLPPGEGLRVDRPACPQSGEPARPPRSRTGRPMMWQRAVVLNRPAWWPQRSSGRITVPLTSGQRPARQRDHRRQPHLHDLTSRPPTSAPCARTAPGASPATTLPQAADRWRRHEQPLQKSMKIGQPGTGPRQVEEIRGPNAAYHAGPRQPGWPRRRGDVQHCREDRTGVGGPQTPGYETFIAPALGATTGYVGRLIEYLWRRHGAHWRRPGLGDY
jgi:hypothetical protein